MNTNTNKILATALAKQGQFGSISYSRPAKTKKGTPHIITKHTVSSGVRFGVSYDAKASVKEKRESGALPATNQGLKGAEWIVPNYIAKATKTGKLQLAVTTTKNTKFKTIWKMNGIEVDKKDIEEYLLASEKTSKEGMVDVFRIGVENIIEIK